MNKKWAGFVSIFALIAMFGIVVFSEESPEKLAIGSPAPELDVGKWVKGEPVKLADGKGDKVYVVEFWATWCPPCLYSIPHLSEIQAKYKDKGVVVVGISKEKLSVVEDFVKAQEKMEYHVAVDSEGKIYDTYMAGVSGIPHAFIVNKDGLVVWSGHPMQALDVTLDSVLDGSYDWEATARRVKQESELDAALDKAVDSGDNDRIWDAASKMLHLKPDDQKAMFFISQMLYNQKRSYQDILKLMDELIEKHPLNAEVYNFKAYFLLQHADDNPDPDVLSSFLADYSKRFTDNPTVLNNMAWMIMEHNVFFQRPLKAIVEMAERAVFITPRDNTDSLAANLDTLARAYYVVGRVDKAVVEQEKALKFAVGKRFEPDMKKTLDYYKTALEIGKSLSD